MGQITKGLRSEFVLHDQFELFTREQQKLEASRLFVATPKVRKMPVTRKSKPKTTANVESSTPGPSKPKSIDGEISNC